MSERTQSPATESEQMQVFLDNLLVQDEDLLGKMKVLNRYKPPRR
jgi:hypothetical protein